MKIVCDYTSAQPHVVTLTKQSWVWNPFWPLVVLFQVITVKPGNHLHQTLSSTLCKHSSDKSFYSTIVFWAFHAALVRFHHQYHIAENPKTQSSLSLLFEVLFLLLQIWDMTSTWLFISLCMFVTSIPWPVLFSYYNLEDITHESINKFLSNLVERSLRDLECSYCMEIKEVRVY